MDNGSAMSQAVVRVKYIRLFRVPGHSVPHAIMSEPGGSGLKLSLERLYKDELGRILPTVHDITPDGHHVFEPCASMFFVKFAAHSSYG